MTEEEERPAYVAVTNTIQFPFTLVSFIGGLAASYIGYAGVFVIVSVFMILALASSFRLYGA